jgi:KaiC/GvpD/RAD55 family RecA-like ATPase
MERRFIKSGVPGLDEILGGGILDGSIITLSGPTGSGKSTLAAQFLYSGATQFNEPGLYLAIEESRRDFFFHISGYVWDFDALEKERKFVFLDYPIHEVDQIVNQSNAIHEIINSTGTRRVVIDSIMPIGLFFKGDEERKKGFLKFIENLRKWNVTTLIISEDFRMSNSGARPTSEFGIESFTDGWINLFYKYDEKAMERMRYVEVIKMKGVAHSAKSYPAHLDEHGFRISSESAPRQMPPRTEAPHEAPAPAPAAPRPLRTIAKPPPEEPAPAPPPMRQLRKIIPDEEMAQLKKLIGEESGKGQQRPPRKAPAKMSPSIAQKLADAKKKMSKKKK